MMDGWIAHEATLTLDAPEGYAECAATYQMAVTYRRGRVDDLRRAELTDWIFNGRHQSRATAVALLGQSEVTRQEELTASQWWDRPAVAAE